MRIVQFMLRYTRERHFLNTPAYFYLLAIAGCFEERELADEHHESIYPSHDGAV